MANDSGGGHGGLYFLVGALVVVVGVIGYFALGQPDGSKNDGPNIKIETPKPPAKTQ